MSRIFISYKRVDKDKVFKIKDQIESALGEKCWIDLDGIESDAQFMNVIIKAIRECEVLLFMYSKTHAQITDFEKDWTVRELNFASKKEKRVVFVNIDGSSLSDEFEFMYGTKQQVDAISPSAMNKLYTDLRTWLSVSAPIKDTLKLTVSPMPKPIPPGDSQIFKVGNVEFKMIRVEGGTFTMGVSEEEGMYIINPMHQVTLSSYSIGETPVTQQLWEEIMGNNPSMFKGGQKPVERVTWSQCQEFINKLNQKTGKRFHLPTEAEWEFAARGGNQSKHYQYSGSNNLDEVAWYDKTSGGSVTHPVKTKKPNELGIYDMSGNVWEWCQDWYGCYTRLSQTDPTGPNNGPFHVCRGGSFNSVARNCLSSYRNCISPDYYLCNPGFRLALSE